TDASLTDRDPPDFTKCLLGREKLKLLNLKGVSGIEMSPVRITVYRNTKVVSSITAGKGKIHFVNSTLILEDKVKIESLEGKWLECEKICWDTVTKRFRTTGHYTARLENSTFEGQGLETDFWLKNLSSRR
ncbi:LPS export ABC transporter periplasmic protein LptC, partial [bacterium]|nr:LPS export ABC transporter periplasmic protein LptC [bacterium]